MRNCLRSRSGFSDAGFSLVELLVVVSIIGLLAGLASVAVPKAIESGKKSKAKGDLTAIVAAVKAYKQEYGQWPVAKSKMDQATDEYNSWYGPPTNESGSKQLVRILSGENLSMAGIEMNPKGVRFLEGASTDGTFRDAWGNQYCVKMDTDESGALEYYAPAGAGENIKMRVIAVSLGKDRTQNDPDRRLTRTCDDVFSWRD